VNGTALTATDNEGSRLLRSVSADGDGNDTVSSDDLFGDFTFCQFDDEKSLSEYSTFSDISFTPPGELTPITENENARVNTLITATEQQVAEVPNKVVLKHAGSDLTVAQRPVPQHQIDFHEIKHRYRPVSAWNVFLSWFNRNIDTACYTNNTNLSTYDEHDTIEHLLNMENYMEPATALGEPKANGAMKRKKNKDYRPKWLADKYALGRFWKEVEKNEEYKNLSESIHAVAEAEQTLWRQLSAESGQNLDPHLYKEISEVIQEVKRGFQCSEGAQVNPGESDKQRESNETVHKFVYNTFAA
jgi:hypothetical protein